MSLCEFFAILSLSSLQEEHFDYYRQLFLSVQYVL